MNKRKFFEVHCKPCNSSVFIDDEYFIRKIKCPVCNSLLTEYGKRVELEVTNFKESREVFDFWIG